MTYVSELQVRENTVIRSERLLIFPGKVWAEVGMSVTPDTILAKTELLPGVPVIVDVAGHFGVAPESTLPLLSKQVGDHVEKGEALAVQENSILEGGRRILASPCKGLIEHISASRGLVLIREESTEDEPVMVIEVAKLLKVSPRFIRTFAHVREGDEVAVGSVLASMDGRGAEAVRSPIRGLVSHIDTRKGTISLQKPYSPSYAKAYLAGQVVELIPERGAIVEATGTYIEGVFGVGGEKFGRLTRLTSDKGEVLDAKHFAETHMGAVVFGGAGITFEGMQAALRNKVAGVIVGGLHSLDLVNLLGKEISIGITGQEEIDTTFIATEGFGHIQMLDYTYELLCKHVGCSTSINGRTQIRAGVQRPEIVICHEVPFHSVAQERPKGARLEVGSKVRAIIDPYFGMTGEVIELLPPTKLPTEVVMNLLKIRLVTGETIELLPNNVELVRFQIGRASD